MTKYMPFDMTEGNEIFKMALSHDNPFSCKTWLPLLSKSLTARLPPVAQPSCLTVNALPVTGLGAMVKTCATVLFTDTILE